MPESLSGKIVIVTGASDGLGKVTADLLLKNGCKIVRIGLEAQGYRELDNENELNIIGDLSLAKTREDLLVRTIKKFGTLDILINNAAIGIYAPSYETTYDELLKIYEVNVFVPNEMMRLVLPIFREKHSGTIVNIGSICGTVTVPWATIYCSTKFALHGITQGFRREVRDFGVHVMLVMPAVIKTNFRRHVIRGKAPTNVERDVHGISPEYVANSIINGIKKKKKNIYVPFVLAYPFMKMQEYTPWLMDWYLRTKQ